MQKTVQLIEQYIPRCSVITDIEHTLLLLFEKIMSLRPISVGYVRDMTSRQRVPKILLPDMSADMSDMSPYVAETCHEDISFSRSSKTQKRHGILTCLCHYNTTSNDMYVIATRNHYDMN